MGRPKSGVSAPKLRRLSPLDRARIAAGETTLSDIIAGTDRPAPKAPEKTTTSAAPEKTVAAPVSATPPSRPITAPRQTASVAPSGPLSPAVIQRMREERQASMAKPKSPSNFEKAKGAESSARAKGVFKRPESDTGVNP